MAYNEAENIPHLLAALTRYLDTREVPASEPPSELQRLTDWEILVVDDGSTDGTGKAVSDAARSNARIRLISHPHNMGMGAAIRSGYKAAGMDFVTQLPADFQVPPETLDLFIPLAPKHDLVLSVYSNRGASPARRFLAAGYRIAARIILGQRADYTGTMLFNRNLLEGIELTTDSFVANLEFPLKALRRGASAALVTFVPSPRLAGESKVANTRRIAFVFAELIRLRHRGL